MTSAPTLCDYLERSAALHADRPAVVGPSGRAMTYGELDDRSSRIAGFLAARGIRPGDRVGVVAPKSMEVVTAFFGIMKAGAAYVPADYAAPAPRTRTVLADCSVRALFLDPDVAALTADWPADEPPEVVVWFGEDGALPSGAGRRDYELGRGNPPRPPRRCPRRGTPTRSPASSTRPARRGCRKA